jgi:hypothetical protein
MALIVAGALLMVAAVYILSGLGWAIAVAGVDAVAFGYFIASIDLRAKK